MRYCHYSAKQGTRTDGDGGSLWWFSIAANIFPSRNACQLNSWDILFVAHMLHPEF